MLTQFERSNVTAFLAARNTVPCRKEKLQNLLYKAQPKDNWDFHSGENFFADVTLCCLLRGHKRRFGGTFCLQLQNEKKM